MQPRIAVTAGDADDGWTEPCCGC